MVSCAVVVVFNNPQTISRNNGILPLNTIPGEFCSRPDGLCSVQDFISSQANATALANFQYGVSKIFSVRYFKV